MLKSFFKSPANRAGMSAWIATVLTAGIQYAVTREMPPLVDLLGIVVGLVAILQPDNAVTVGELETAIADVRVAMGARTPGNLARVMGDAAMVVESAAPPAPVR